MDLIDENLKLNKDEEIKELQDRFERFNEIVI